MNYLAIIITIGIAILYPFFWKKLSDLIVKTQVVETHEQKTHEDGMLMIHHSHTSEVSETARFFVLIVAGVVAILVSIWLGSSNTSNGLAIGGLFSIITAIYDNWGNMAELMKVVVIGLTLGVMILMPSVMYQRMGQIME